MIGLGKKYCRLYLSGHPKTSFVVDSGASFHTVTDRALLCGVVSVKGSKRLRSADGLVHKTAGAGPLIFSTGTKSYTTRAELVPAAGVNILSVSTLLADGCAINFEADGGTLTLPWGDKAELKKRGSMWVLETNA